MNAVGWLLAVTLVPGVSARAPSSRLHDPPPAAVLHHLASAGTLQVFRLGEHDPEGHGSWNWAQPGWLVRHQIVSEAHVDRAWQRRMAAILADSTHYVQRIVDFTSPGYALFGLRFIGGGRTSDVLILPETQSWSVWSQGESEGVGYFDADGPEILALLTSALRADPVVRRLAPDGRLAPRDGGLEAPRHTNLAQFPEAIARPAPEYPPLAKKAGIEGTVILMVTVRRDGSVGRVSVRQSVPSLDGAALAAVRHWSFRPGLDTAGRPIECQVAIPMRFKLH